eukprot:TRINITY_DN181_c0_g1_i2.p1 TRINITY_DN181_c0_g1~~TRINITY_DN181_c0_g1_i2.p1  ORF type:complete len:72 (+),score=11.97 TRINITY_DN181_c0_g1_i2:165-380(+)
MIDYEANVVDDRFIEANVVDNTDQVVEIPQSISKVTMFKKSSLKRSSTRKRRLSSILKMKGQGQEVEIKKI